MTPTYAHEGPEETIEHLTEHINELGPTPKRLYQRATEYRALGQLEKAIKDLQHAIRLKTNHVPSLAELSEISLVTEAHCTALRAINRALAEELSEAQKGGFHIIRARALVGLHREEEAVDACEEAFRNESPDPDRYLLRSEVLAQLGRHAIRVKGLEEGFNKTGSAVIEEEWVEAMIDAGEHEKALNRINQHVEQSRWKSSWLVRRGRVLLAQQSPTAARKDLHTAITEINQRLNPNEPDLFLLADRGLAFALLGKRDAAQQDLQLGLKAGAQPWAIRRLQSMLK